MQILSKLSLANLYISNDGYMHQLRVQCVDQGGLLRPGDITSLKSPFETGLNGRWPFRSRPKWSFESNATYSSM